MKIKNALQHLINIAIHCVLGFLLSSCQYDEMTSTTENYLNGSWEVDSTFPAPENSFKDYHYYEQYADQQITGFYYDVKRNKIYSQVLDSFQVKNDRIEIVNPPTWYSKIDSFLNFNVEKLSSNHMKQIGLWDTSQTSIQGLPYVYYYSRIIDLNKHIDSLLSHGKREILPCDIIEEEYLEGYWKLEYQEENIEADSIQDSFIFIDSVGHISSIWLGNKPELIRNKGLYKDRTADWYGLLFNVKCLSESNFILEYEDEYSYALQQYSRIDANDYIPDSMRVELK